jgi:sugar-specific transcriptional regulator TrmB
LENQYKPRINQGMIDAFVRLGLTSVQARVYLAALLGCSKVTQIANASNVGSGDVYRALNSLQSLGLVLKNVGTPNTFAPLAFDDTVMVLINQKKKEDRKMEAELKELHLAIERFEAYKGDSSKEPELSWVPPKLIHHKAHQIVKNAQKEVCGIFSAENMLLISKEQESNKNTRLNLQTRVITERRASLMAFPSFERMSNTQLRYQENPVSVNIFFNDIDELFLTAVPGGKVGFCSNVFSDNPCLAQVFREYFEFKWREASTKP